MPGHADSNTAVTMIDEALRLARMGRFEMAGGVLGSCADRMKKKGGGGRSSGKPRQTGGTAGGVPPYAYLDPEALSGDAPQFQLPDALHPVDVQEPTGESAGAIFAATEAAAA